MLYLSTGYAACFGEQKLVCDASGSVISSVISRITGRCDNTVTILRDSINNPFWWSKTIYLVASTCAIAESTSGRSGWTRAQTRLPDWAGPMTNPYARLNTHPTSHHNGPHRSDVGSGRDTYLVLDYLNKLLESSQCCTSVITTPCDDTDEITLPKAPQTSFRSPKQVQYPVDSYSTVILNINAFKKINC